MGDAAGTGRADEQPPHPVTLSRFWMSPRLVTVQEYCEFLNDCDCVKVAEDLFIVPKDAKLSEDRSWGTYVNLPFAPIEQKDGKYIPKAGQENKPMYYVTWDGAVAYCNWLSAKHGLNPVYSQKENWAWNRSADGYHLPTEAQWECAARGGERNRLYPWGNSASPKLANYANDTGKIADAGTYAPNPYGIRDLSGNVLEWCQDWYQADYYKDCDSGAQNPAGPADVGTDAAQMRALRGAMYYQPLTFHTCSRRYGTSDTKGCFNFNGFRVVREDPVTVRDFRAHAAPARGTDTEMQALAAWFARNFQDKAVPFSFVLGGKPSASLLPRWRISSTERNAGNGRKLRTIMAVDPRTALEFRCEATTFDSFPAVEWVVRVTNRGSKESPLIQDLMALDAKFDKPADERREFILRHSKGSRATTEDFMSTDGVLLPGSRRVFGGHGGRSCDYDLPFMNLQRGKGGVTLAIGWTGQWQACFERDQSDGLQIKAGLECLQAKLLPGESIRTPRILASFWDGEDMLRGHNLFRQVLLAHYSPRVNGKLVHPPVALSAAGLNGYTEANQLAAIPKLKTHGVETLWIDAGWFVGGWPNGAGNWVPKPEVFPRGFAPVGEAAEAAGLDFLVWFELERVSKGSRLAREHPEWVIGPITEYGGLLNFGNPDARRWITDHVSGQIADGKIDVLRQDMNMEPLGYWLRNDTAGRLGITENKFVEGMYAMFDELRARHPNLWIDNCASGGRNIDFEMMTRSIPLWQSDMQCIRFHAEQGQMQNHGLNLYIPLHSGGLGCIEGAMEPSYGFRSSMMSGNPQAFDMNAPVEKVKPTVDTTLKARPYFEGDYYPLFAPSLDLHRWFGYQLHLPGQDKGMLMAFRRAKCPSETALVVRAIDPQKQYRLTDHETGETRNISGSELQVLGIKVPDAPGSRLLFYEAVAVQAGTR